MIDFSWRTTKERLFWVVVLFLSLTLIFALIIRAEQVDIIMTCQEVEPGQFHCEER